MKHPFSSDFIATAEMRADRHVAEALLTKKREGV